MAEQTPDSIITTQKNGQTIVAELFFNHSGTETFRDKLLKVILADSLQDGQEPEKTEITREQPPRRYIPRPGGFYRQKRRFLQVKSRRKHPKNAPVA